MSDLIEVKIDQNTLKSVMILVISLWIVAVAIVCYVILRFNGNNGKKNKNSNSLTIDSSKVVDEVTVGKLGKQLSSGSLARRQSYRFDEEGSKITSSEYSGRGPLYIQRASWQLPEAPRIQVNAYGVYNGNYGIDYITTMLRRYNVDPDTGFLPSQDPLSRLPYARYHVWEDLANDIPKLLGARLGQARGPLKKMPVISTSKLTSEPELRRAHLLLCLLAHSYVWGGSEPIDVIPEGISKPLTEVSEKLGIPPVISHTSICLVNWRRLDKEADICMENLSTLNNFFDGRDESWFYLIHCEIEAVGASAIVPVMLAIDAIQRYNENTDSEEEDGDSAAAISAIEDTRTNETSTYTDKCLTNVMVGSLSKHNTGAYVTGQLKKISVAIGNMCTSIGTMNEGCHPFIFYHRVRPFLSGWKDNPTLPSGVIYENCYGDERQFFVGASAAQSPLIPFLDICLGISHASNPKSKSSSEFLRNMRNYMVRPHREFLIHCEKIACIREFVVNLLQEESITIDEEDNPQDTEEKDNLWIKLRDAYNDCLLAMRRFRSAHMKLVADYIIAQQRSIKKDDNTKDSDSTAETETETKTTSQSGGVKKLEGKLEQTAGGKGTGGTELMAFLKPIRDNCGESVVGKDESTPMPLNKDQMRNNSEKKGNSGEPELQLEQEEEKVYHKANSDKEDLDVYRGSSNYGSIDVELWKPFYKSESPGDRW